VKAEVGAVKVEVAGAGLAGVELDEVDGAPGVVVAGPVEVAPAVVPPFFGDR
jgi:hypothetical protein